MMRQRFLMSVLLFFALCGAACKRGTTSSPSSEHAVSNPAGSQANKVKLYGLGSADQRIYDELFDAAGSAQGGFALTAPGRFLMVAEAQQT